MLKSLKKYLNIHDDLYTLEKPSRGIASSKWIKKDQEIIKIPEKFLIQPSIVPYFKKLEGKVHENSIIAYFLYKESQKKDSFWKFYIKTFPTKTSVEKDYPIYLSKTIKKKIADTKFGKLLKSHEENIKKDYETIKSFFKEEIPFNNYLYYRLLITSRIFQYNNIIYMVPYVDLFNHSKKPNTRWFFKNEHFILQATKRIPAHSEIFDYYGNKTNSILYLFYGFTFSEKKKSKKFASIGNTNLQNILP
jgi:hypothetical protein